MPTHLSDIKKGSKKPFNSKNEKNENSEVQKEKKEKIQRSEDMNFFKRIHL